MERYLIIQDHLAVDLDEEFPERIEYYASYYDTPSRDITQHSDAGISKLADLAPLER